MTEDNKYIDNLFKEKLAERTFVVPDAFLADLEKRLDAPKVGSKKVKGFWFWLTSLAIAITSVSALAYLRDFPNSSISENVSLFSVAKTPQMAQNYLNIHPINERIQEEIIEIDRSESAAKPTFPARKKVEKVEAPIFSQGDNLIKNTSVETKGDALTLTKPLEDKAIEQKSEPTILHRLLAKDLSFGANCGSFLTGDFKEGRFTYIDDSTNLIRYVVRDTVICADKPEEGKARNAKKTKFEVQAYGGFGLVKPKIESPFVAYKNALESNEQTSITPDFGFRLNLYYNSFTVGSGMNFYQFGEKTNYSILSISQEINSIDSNITLIFLDSLGNIWTPASQFPIVDTITQITVDTSYTIDSTSSSKQWINAYSRIVIPFNFGYRFDYKKWSFIPRVGLNFEFTTAQQQGLYMDAKQEEILALDQRKFGLSYQFQFEFRRNFDNWHVFVNPYYRNNLGYVIETTDLKRKYGVFGTTFGIGVTF